AGALARRQRHADGAVGQHLVGRRRARRRAGAPPAGGQRLRQRRARELLLRRGAARRRQGERHRVPARPGGAAPVLSRRDDRRGSPAARVAVAAARPPADLPLPIADPAPVAPVHEAFLLKRAIVDISSSRSIGFRIAPSVCSARALSFMWPSALSSTTGTSRSSGSTFWTM